MPTRVFLSHDAAHDEPLAKAVAALLASGLDIDVFRGGAFDAPTRAALRDAECVVALVTESFWGNSLCAAEIGVAWCDEKKKLFPILVPPSDDAALRGVVDRAEAFALGRAEDLDRLRDALASRLGIRATAAWNAKRDELLAGLAATLKACAKPADALRMAEDALERIQKIVDDVHASRRATPAKRFIELVGTAGEAIHGLPNVVVDALYLWELDEEYVASPYDSGDAHGAAKMGYLRAGERGFVVNEAHPRIRAAIDALDSVRAWLEAPPTEFAAWYTAEAEGEEPSLALRAFWQRHLGICHW